MLYTYFTTKILGIKEAKLTKVENTEKTYNFSVETMYKISVALDIRLDKFIDKR